MPPIISRWIPFACVILASYLLWSASRVPLNIDQEKSTTRLRSPLPASDYSTPSDLRDPFEPPGEGKSTTPNRGADAGKKETSSKPAGPAVIHLDGIIWDPDKPLAIINGKMFGKGQKGDSFVVEDIFVDGVRLNAASKNIEKRLEKVR